jgi:hypothetical protein
MQSKRSETAFGKGSSSLDKKLIHFFIGPNSLVKTMDFSPRL